MGCAHAPPMPPIPDPLAELGILSFKGERYKLGRAFAKKPVGIQEQESGMTLVLWGDFALANLKDFKV